MERIPEHLKNFYDAAQQVPVKPELAAISSMLDEIDAKAGQQTDGSVSNWLNLKTIFIMLSIAAILTTALWWGLSTNSSTANYLPMAYPELETTDIIDEQPTYMSLLVRNEADASPTLELGSNEPQFVEYVSPDEHWTDELFTPVPPSAASEVWVDSFRREEFFSIVITPETTRSDLEILKKEVREIGYTLKLEQMKFDRDGKIKSFAYEVYINPGTATKRSWTPEIPFLTGESKGVKEFEIVWKNDADGEVEKVYVNSTPFQDPYEAVSSPGKMVLIKVPVANFEEGFELYQDQLKLAGYTSELKRVKDASGTSARIWLDMRVRAGVEFDSTCVYCEGMSTVRNVEAYLYMLVKYDPNGAIEFFDVYAFHELDMVNSYLKNNPNEVVISGEDLVEAPELLPFNVAKTDTFSFDNGFSKDQLRDLEDQIASTGMKVSFKNIKSSGGRLTNVHVDLKYTLRRGTAVSKYHSSWDCFQGFTSGKLVFVYNEAGDITHCQLFIDGKLSNEVEVR